MQRAVADRVNADRGAAIRPSAAPVVVRRRKVFFITGYDPRSPAVYYRLFASEHRDFLERAGLSGGNGEIERHLPPERQTLRWRMTSGEGASAVTTDFELLGWRDLIAREFRFPAWKRVALGLATFAAMVRHGLFTRYLRNKWEGAAIAFFPFAMMILYLLVMAGLVTLGALLGDLVPLPVPAPLRSAIGAALGALTALGFYRFTRRIDQTVYAWYLVNDWISMRGLARDRDPALARRLSAFALRIREAAADPQFDEVLVVGHSSGSVLALMAVHEALEGSEVRPTRRPRLSLLTLGSNFFCVGMFRPAVKLTAALAAIGRRADVTWADVFAPQDIMSFKIDPVAEWGGVAANDPAKVNPALVSAHLAASLSAERYGAVRWRFFTLHFQFLVAPDHPGHYDFYRCIAGPTPLRSLVLTRFAAPRETVSP